MSVNLEKGRQSPFIPDAASTTRERRSGGPGNCTVCRHPSRLNVELAHYALMFKLQGIKGKQHLSLRSIGRAYSLSKDAISEHYKNSHYRNNTASGMMHDLVMKAKEAQGRWDALVSNSVKSFAEEKLHTPGRYTEYGRIEQIMITELGKAAPQVIREYLASPGVAKEIQEIVSARLNETQELLCHFLREEYVLLDAPNFDDWDSRRDKAIQILEQYKNKYPRFPSSASISPFWEKGREFVRYSQAFEDIIALVLEETEVP